MNLPPVTLLRQTTPQPVVAELAGEARPLPFDAAGSLEQEKQFPHSVRGRRGHTV